MALNAGQHDTPKTARQKSRLFWCLFVCLLLSTISMEI